MSVSRFLIIHASLFMAAAVIALAVPAHATITAAGTDTATGYQWVDSSATDGPVFAMDGSWSTIDISSTGTPIGSTSFDWSLSVPMGFTADVFGTARSSMFVGANGYLTVAAERDWSPDEFGSGSTNPSPMIGLGFTDMDEGPSFVTYETSGSSPDRVFAVQYDVPHYTTGDMYRMQVRLYEFGDAIEVHYNTFAPTRDTAAGLQRSGTAGISYSWPLDTLTGRAVHFRPVTAGPCESTDDAYAVNEDATLVIGSATGLLSNDRQIGAVPLEAVQTSEPTDGTITSFSSDGSFTYKPDPDFFGSDSFTYQATDHYGDCTSATVTITVDPVNDDPTANDDSHTVDEDSTGNSFAVLANDEYLPDASETLTVAGVTSGTQGAWGHTPTAVTYTPTADFFGTASATYEIEDGNGGSDTATVTVTVQNVNDDPIAVDDTGHTMLEEGGPSASPKSIDVLLNDDVAPDTGETLSVTDVTGGHGIWSHTSTTVSFLPTTDFVGLATATYTISDGNGGTATAEVEIEVQDVNDPPTITAGDPLTRMEDAGTVTVSGWATDITGGPANEDQRLVSSLVSASDPSLFDGTPMLMTTGDLRFTTAQDAFGSSDLRFLLSDGDGTANGGEDSVTVDVTITIDPVNDPPSFRPGGIVAVDEDTAHAPQAWATAIKLGPANEVPPQTATFTVEVQDPALFSVQPTIDGSGRLAFTPAAQAHGTTTAQVVLDDGGGGTSRSSEQLEIRVRPVNDPPVAADDAMSSYEDMVDFALDVLDNDEDEDGEPLVLDAAALTQPHDAAVRIEDNRVLFTPDPGFSGTTSFQYGIVDSAGATDTATVTVTVSDPTEAVAVLTGPDVVCVGDSVDLVAEGHLKDTAVTGYTVRASSTAAAEERSTADRSTVFSVVYSTKAFAVADVTVAFADGSQATATHALEVQNCIPPRAVLDLKSFGRKVFLDSLSTDEDGDIVEHAWTFSDGSSATGKQVEHTFDGFGHYLIRLTVTDDEGHTGTTTRSITFTAPPSGDSGTRASGDGSSGAASQQSVNANAGVASDDGASDQEADADAEETEGEQQSIADEVHDDAPSTDGNETKDVPLTVSMAVAPDGLEHDFTASLDGPVRALHWDFGDGATSNLESPSHTYEAPGTYTVRLTGSDADGRSAQAVQVVHVQESAPLTDTGTARDDVPAATPAATDPEAAALPASGFVALVVGGALLLLGMIFLLALVVRRKR